MRATAIERQPPIFQPNTYTDPTYAFFLRFFMWLFTSRFGFWLMELRSYEVVRNMDARRTPRQMTGAIEK